MKFQWKILNIIPLKISMGPSRNYVIFLGEGGTQRLCKGYVGKGRLSKDYVIAKYQQNRDFSHKIRPKKEDGSRRGEEGGQSRMKKITYFLDGPQIIKQRIRTFEFSTKQRKILKFSLLVKENIYNLYIMFFWICSLTS